MPVYLLNEEIVFPNPEEAVEDGLLAIGGDLHIKRLLLAYSNGIFPWYSDDIIMWWSPDPRLIMIPDELIVSKSLKKTIKKEKFTIEFDKNFNDVIDLCSCTPRKNEDGTWITTEMKNAYIKLHELGFAHSVETYFEGRLVGGLYGISIGKAFFGESMFHLMSDASKVAYFYLVEKLKEWDFKLIDAQIKTDHLITLGAKEISRNDFLKLLSNCLSQDSHIGKW